MKIALLLLAVMLSLASYSWLTGATWLSVYAVPALCITIGVGVDDVFIMTQASLTD